MRTAVYEAILSELEAGERNSIARRLFRLFQQHPEGLDRRTLVWEVYGVQAKEDLSSDTRDRKIRNTISRMRARRIPIVSTSGEAGYRLDDSQEARHAMLNDWIAKRNSLNDQIEAASIDWQIPLAYIEPEIEVQGKLL